MLRVRVHACECGTDLINLGAMDADGFVKGFAGDTEEAGPVVNVGGDLGVDFVWVAGAWVYVFCHVGGASPLFTIGCGLCAKAAFWKRFVRGAALRLPAAGISVV